MSTTVSFFVFTCIICLVVGYNDIEDEVPWLKPRQIQIQNQRLRDRFMNGAVRGRNSICTGTRQGAQVQGVCRPLKECRLRGGTNAGTCALLGTCCVFERTCFNTTNAKLSYFVAPQTFQPQCSLTVNLFNRDVCQIRLDFDRFTIGQPTSPNLAFVGNSWQCNNDSFTVSSTNPNLGFVHLCGENTGQHIYIPVNGTQGTSSVTLNFQFAGDRNTTSVQPLIPDWRIRITQLECATLPTDFTNIQTYLQTMVQRLQNHKSNNIQTDASRIAPPGCLQYYTERQGSYESFNYNGGVGPYIGQTNYAICFRRTADICGIRHTPVQFIMNFNIENNNNQFVTVCRPNDVANGTLNQDYVHIPGGVMNGTTPREFYCDTDLNATSVTSTVPGPMYVAVRTDNIANETRREFGFRFNYQILSTGCTTL